MHFQIAVAPPTPGMMMSPVAEPLRADGVVELLGRLIDIQNQQLDLQRAQAAKEDHLARWRALLNRWTDDYPGMGNRCREILPHLEKSYLRLIDELAGQLANEDENGIDNDFTLNEFLDRYGSRLSQLGTILGMVGTLADAGKQDGSPKA